MKTTLYEFMPYGAPELIEARSRHLSRALVLACATAIAVLGAAMGIGSLIPHPAIIVVDTPIDPRKHDAQELKIKQPLPPPLVEPARSIAPMAKPSPIATPVAVPDAQAPVVKDEPSGPMPSTSTTTGPSTQTKVEPGTGDQPPPLGVYVYVEHLPAALKQVKPVYSDIAKEAGVQGLVRVNVLVGKDGRVMDARVDEKAQIPLLNDAALAAARQWVFTAGTSNDQPVMCWVSIPFNFRLH